jgi:hypothetical protein
MAGGQGGGLSNLEVSLIFARTTVLYKVRADGSTLSWRKSWVIQQQSLLRLQTVQLLILVTWVRHISQQHHMVDRELMNRGIS